MSNVYEMNRILMKCMHTIYLFTKRRCSLYDFNFYIYIHIYICIYTTYTSLGWFSCVKYIFISLCVVWWERAWLCVYVYLQHSITVCQMEWKLFYLVLLYSQTHWHQHRNKKICRDICFSFVFFFLFNIVKCKRIWHHVEVNLKVANFFFGRNTMDAYSSIHRRKKLNPLLIIYMWMNFKNHMTQIYLINLKPITILTTFDRDWWLLFLDFFVNFRTF